MKSLITLRSNQIPIVEEAIKKQECVIYAGTGLGKTLIAIELITRLGLTTTIIVHNTAMLDQFAGEIKKFLDYNPGIIGCGQKAIKPITIATIQSLQADENILRLLAGNTSILIVDEAQNYVSPKRLKILNHFRPKYLYGLSATPTRSKDDGRGPAVNFIFGPNTQYAENASLKPVVEIIRSNEPIPVDDYHRIIDRVVDNANRNVLIQGIALGEALQTRKVLILTKRRAHGQLLYDLFPPHWRNSAVYLIDSADKGRNELIASFKEARRQFSIIIGTTSLLSVGIDIPSLDTLILAADMKSEILTAQSCGRILRLFEGKPDPKIIDIVDNKNAILWRQFRERLKFYQSKKWEVKGL